MIKGKLTIQYNTNTEKYSVYNKPNDRSEPIYMGFIARRINHSRSKWFIYSPTIYIPDTDTFIEAKEVFVTIILDILVGVTKVSELVSDDGNNWSITYE